MKSAGTDANVFIQMYGETGKTEEYKLRNRSDNFERGQVDKFKVTFFKCLFGILQTDKLNTSPFSWRLID